MSDLTFGPTYAAVYDALYGQKDYTLECDVIEAAFREAGRRVSSVLDLGCGTGGHSIELARRGYRVTGLDRSSEMLALATRKAAGVGVSIDWHQGDMREFSLQRRFDAVISMFSVVGYLTRNDELLASFRRVRNHLDGGAPFLMDLWFGPAVLNLRPEPRRRTIVIEGESFDRSVTPRVDLIGQVCNLSYRLTPKSSKVRESLEEHRVRFFFPQEIRLLLEGTGFTLTGLTKFPTLDEPADETSWSAFVRSMAGEGD